MNDIELKDKLSKSNSLIRYIENRLREAKPRGALMYHDIVFILEEIERHNEGKR